MKICFYIDEKRQRRTELHVTELRLLLDNGESVQITECQRSTQAFRVRVTDGCMLLEPRVSNEFILVPASTIYRVGPLFQEKPAYGIKFPPYEVKPIKKAKLKKGKHK